MRESIVRAKVAPERQHRILRGMMKCGKCLACSYVKEGKTVIGKRIVRNSYGKLVDQFLVIAKT